MATKLFTRSPRYVSITGAANDTTSVEVFLWNDPSSIPATPQHTLSKPIPSTLATTVYYNVSDYARKYINHISYVEVSSQAVVPVTEYCYMTTKTYLNGALVATTDFICFDGYGDFEDGANPAHNLWLTEEGSYYVKENDNGGGLHIFTNGSVTLQVKYTNLATAAVTTVNVTGDVKKFPYVHTDNIAVGNSVVLFNSAGAGATLASWVFTAQCEPKYTPVECDYVNKYGTWQRLIFFKAKKTNIDISGTDYKLMPSSPIYNTSVGHNKMLNINGKENVLLNTGWVNEANSEAIQQLMLSEVILLDGRPAKMRTKSIEKQLHINSKLINYAMEFDYANDIINNIM